MLLSLEEDYMKRRFLFFTLILLLFSILSMEPMLAQELKREECLIITEEEGTATLPGPNFNPYSPDAWSVWHMGIFETLYIFDNIKFGLIPWIADGLPAWVDEYTLEVKLKDAYWQDGSPLTSEDIIYSYELPKRYPETGAVALAMWPSLKKIEAVDAHTIRFYVNESLPFKVSIYETLCFGWIIPKHIFKEAEKEYKSITEFTFESPIGSGPYKLLKWEPTRIIKERWDEWWGRKYFGLPEPKYLIYIPSTGNEETNRMISLAVVDGLSAIAPGWKDMQKYGVFSWFTEPPFVSPYPVRVNFIAINNERFRERFGEYDSRIKMALAYAIDRKIMCERGFFELAVPINDPTFILPDSPLAFLRDEEVVRDYTFAYDPDKAKRILDEANIVDRDGDGIRDLPDGTPVTLTTIDVEGWTDWMAVNELFKTYAIEIGIYVEALHLDYSVWESRVRAGDYDTMTYSTSAWSPSGLWAFLGVFDYRYPSWPMIEGSPLRYRNDELCSIRDELAKYPNPLDPEVKPVLKELMGKAQKIIAKDLPAIPVGVWGYEFGFQTKYWSGWPTESNPYPFDEQGNPGFLNVLLHLKSTAAPTIPLPPSIPEEMEETIASIYNATLALNTAVNSLSISVENLASMVRDLQMWLTILVGLNIVILIIVLVVLLFTRKIKG